MPASGSSGTWSPVANPVWHDVARTICDHRHPACSPAGSLLCACRMSKLDIVKGASNRHETGKSETTTRCSSSNIE